jgi:hypothetical protein
VKPRLSNILPKRLQFFMARLIALLGQQEIGQPPVLVLTIG